MAYERIGDVLGLPVQANLGQSKEALASYQQALTIQKALVERDPSNESLRRDMASLYKRICRVEENTGKFRESLESCRAAAAIEEALLRARPGDTGLRGDLAFTYQNMAGAYFALGDWPRSEEQRRHVLNEYQELYRLRPDNEPFLYGLANAYHRMANLQEQTKHYPEAKANVLEAIRLFNLSAERNPKESWQARGLDLRPAAPGQHPDFDGRSARRARRLPEGAADSRATAEPGPAGRPRAVESRQQPRLASVTCCWKWASPAKRRSTLNSSARSTKNLVRVDPLAVSHSYSLSEAYENLGRVAYRLGQEQRARAYLNDALKIYDELRARNAISAEYAEVPARIQRELK